MGFVPEYESREAAKFVHVPWNTWHELSAHDRAAAVAHYRMSLLIDAHIHDASKPRKSFQS